MATLQAGHQPTGSRQRQKTLSKHLEKAGNPQLKPAQKLEKAGNFFAAHTPRF
jgi:hypothetical protein